MSKKLKPSLFARILLVLLRLVLVLAVFLFIVGFSGVLGLVVWAISCGLPLALAVLVVACRLYGSA